MHAAHRQPFAISSSISRFDERALSHVLRVWFGLGLVALFCIPAARGASLWIGYLPYWLVAAPLLSMAVLNRKWLQRTCGAHASIALRLGKRRSWLTRNRRIKPRAMRRPTALRASLAALVSGRR